MALYAIGDIQGCWIELEKLLDKINFSPEEDTLWFTGDLVNRGPGSLETLRFVKSLGDSAVTVLGNHDLHLLAVAYDQKKAHRNDTFDALKKAHDREELLNWLARRPLLHSDPENGFDMVHAGIPPQWDMDEARRRAHEVETVLKSDQLIPFLSHMYGNEPSLWSEELTGWERLRYITNCFTRLRYCDIEGRLYMKPKGAPGSQPDSLIPWFEHPQRKSRNAEIICGHWSTLGFKAENGIYSIDTGCLWGGQLTALRLDGEELYRTSLDCPCILNPDQKKLVIQFVPSTDPLKNPRK